MGKLTMSLAPKALEDVIFRVATEGDISNVLKLRDHVYVRHFGQNPDDGQDRLGQHLVAVTSNDQIVAGVRLLGSALRPFDFEHIFDLSSEIDSSRRPAMLGRLFVREDYRSVDRSTYLLSGLLKLTLTVAIEQGITDYYMYTFSHLLRFYRRAGFRAVGTTVYHEQWRTLHLMHMDVVATTQAARSDTAS